MSNDSSNPYSSQSGGGMQPPMRPVTGMDYMRMSTYVFENPNWLMNLLIGSAYALIILVGWIALFGYTYEVMMSLPAAGGAKYPDLKFDRFGDYLLRGLWPFLVYVIGSLLITPLHAVAIYLSNGGMVGSIIALPVLVGAPIIVLFFIQPIMMRAALALDFVEGFKLDWVKDFIARVWVEMLIGTVLLHIFAYIALPLGVLCCCVGLLPVVPLLALAHAHFFYQLYSLYLTRGGTPVPVRMSGQPVLGPM